MKDKVPSWDDTTEVAEPPAPKWEETQPADAAKSDYSVEGFAKNLGKNALDMINPIEIAKGAGSLIKQGLVDAPIAALKDQMTITREPAELLTGKKKLSDVPKDIANLETVKMVKKQVEPIAKHPVDFAYNRPLDAASLLLAPIAPFLGRGAAAAAIERGAADAAVDTAATGLGRRMVAKTISTAFGAPEEAVIERMKNPTGIKTAFSHPELADQMVSSIKNFGDQIKDLGTKASENLRSSPYIEEGAIPKDRILSAVKAARSDLGGVFSQESKSAAKALSSVKDLYESKLRNTVSESQVKDLIQQLDSDIDWGNPQASRTNEALVGVRTRLDGILKTQNPAYREAMAPVNEAMKVMNEMQKKFGIQRKTGEGFVLSDQTVNKIKSALKDDRLNTQNILDRFQNITGEDWESKIKNANVAQAFTGEKTQGSRRAVVGGAVGTAAGYMTHLPPAITGALGAITGAFTDIYGRRLAGTLADVLSVPEMRRYIPVMQKAAVRGPAALAMVHAKLMENDPDYTAAMAAAVHDAVSSNDTKRP